MIRVLSILLEKERSPCVSRWQSLKRSGAQHVLLCSNYYITSESKSSKAKHISAKKKKIKSRLWQINVSSLKISTAMNSIYFFASKALLSAHMTNQFREHCLREMRSLTQGRMRERREAKLGSGLSLTQYTRAPPSSKHGIKMQPTSYASTCIMRVWLSSESHITFVSVK